MNAAHSRDLKVIFDAFLMDESSRKLLQERQFAALCARDARLREALSRLEAEEREMLMDYLTSSVSLHDFRLAA